jgi:hypothetical protein
MILFALTILVMLFKKERNSKETFLSVVPAQPTKCFSCENQLPSNKKYLSGPSKCFSCEEDLLKRNPASLPGLGQPTKCFSCERQMI